MHNYHEFATGMKNVSGHTEMSLQGGGGGGSEKDGQEQKTNAQLKQIV